MAGSGGTGLGLSMIHGYVQQSGGRVLLRSAEGQGTTVSVYLPRYAGAVEPARGRDATIDLPEASTSAVVLVVEDEAPVRMVVVDVLTDLGCAVLQAEDGPSGLRIVTSGARVDLLLSDVGLPGGMNGRQLADAARQLRPDLKVLFMTGYASGTNVGGLVDQGMQVITKPFQINALATRMQGILDSAPLPVSGSI